jgi:predicted anti-sigma-YlaC factor YlaD
MAMQCDRWQDALSAMADGEDPGVEPRLVEAHVAHCSACSTFAQAIDGSRRRAVVQAAPHMPDLSRRVSKLNAIADRASRWSVVRALLAIVAIEVIVVSLPSLVAGDGEVDAHDARHLGAFTIAYGVALLVVVVRPARARTVLPVAAVLAGALLITAVVDLARGVVPLIDEATHIPEVISVVLIWLLAVPAPRRVGNAQRPPFKLTSASGKRPVADDQVAGL